MSIGKKILGTTMVLGLGLAGASLVAPSADAAPWAAPVAPLKCGVTAGMTGSLGHFADVAPLTPHASEINYFYQWGYTQGWSIACYENPTLTLSYVASGGTITITGISDGSAYGVIEESPFRNAYAVLQSGTGTDTSTVGYIFKPEQEVTRADNAVWAAHLLLLTLNVVDSTVSPWYTLDATVPYYITQLNASKWALDPGTTPASPNAVTGPDGKCGTSDDGTVAWIKSTSKSWAKFADVAEPGAGGATNNQQYVDQRHYGSIQFLANLIVDLKLDSSCNIVDGQRVTEGWESASDAYKYTWTWKDGSTSSRDFRPNASIARADFAAFMYRIAKVAKQTTATPTLNLSLRAPIDGWYSHQDDVYWLRGAGITTGYPDGLFHGELPVYRQDAAAFYFRMQNYIIYPQF
jgi:hypothetical protein